MLMEKLRGGTVSNKLADDLSESSSLVRGGRTTRRQAGRLAAAASAELLSSSSTTTVSSSQAQRSDGCTGDSGSGGGSARSDSPSSSSPSNLKNNNSSSKVSSFVAVRAAPTKVVSPSQNTTAAGKSFKEILSISPPVVSVKEELCSSGKGTFFPSTTSANPISTSLSTAQTKWNSDLNTVENNKSRDCGKKTTRGRCGNKQGGTKSGGTTLESKKQETLERKNNICGAGDSVINSSGASVTKDYASKSSSTNYGNSGQNNVGESCSEKSVRNSFRVRGGAGGGAGGESLAWEESNFHSRPHPPPKVMTEKPKLAPMLLMNNLPYMGELTFDTRPRRGRKPKKADICHLISKNYGIQFPNSYTNSPNTGSFPAPNAAQSVNAPAPKKASKKSSATKKITSATWRSSGGGGGVAMDCGLPPDLVPLSTSGNVPQCSLRLSHSGSSPVSVSQTSSVQSGDLWGGSSKISSMYNCNNGTSREGMSSGRKMDEDEPLNLCLRDSPSNHFNSSPLSPPTSQINTLSPIPSQSSFKSKVSAGGGFHKDHSGSLTSLNMKSSLGGDSMQGVSPSSTCDAHLVNNNVKNGGQRKNSGARGSALNGVAQTVPASGNSSNNNNSILGKTSSSISSCSSSAKVKGKRKRSGGGFMPPPPPPTSSANKFSSMPSSSSASLQDSSAKDAMEKAKAAAYTAGNSLFGQPSSCSRAEVSICKFKFTGGAKPSLQEKKMLSVDSGGNFRFYTDKATSSSSKSFRASISNSSTRPDFENDCQYPLSSLPKSAKSMSMCMPVPVTSMTSLSISKGETLTSFCQFPKPIETTGIASARGSSSSRVSSSSSLASPPVSSTLPGYSKAKTKNVCPSRGGGGGGSVGGGDGQPSTTFASGDESVSCSSDNSNSNSRFSGLLAGVSNQSAESSKSGAIRIRPPNTPNSNKLKMKRKRRTRKSLMREKLEKTFKEKGFLIQTQQLESAEGATYCKFRQLRKFTRYLFRSWKDYLPDNVKDIQRAPGSAPANNSSPVVSPAMSPTAVSMHPSIGFGDGVPQNVPHRKSVTKSERQRRTARKCEAIEVDGEEDDGSNDEECESDGENEGEDCGELEQEPEEFKREPCEEDNYLSPGDYFAHTRDESHSDDEDVDMGMDTGEPRPSIPPTSPEDDNDVDEEEESSDSDHIDE